MLPLAANTALALLGLAICGNRTAQAFVPVLPTWPSHSSRTGGEARTTIGHDRVELDRKIQPAVRNRLSMRSSGGGKYDYEGRDHVNRGDHERLPLSRGDFGRLALGAIGASVLVGGGGAQQRSAYAEEDAEKMGDAAEAVTMAPEIAAAPPASEAVALRDMGIEVPYTGKSLPLNKFLGNKATLVVNPKIDDPESLKQMPGITKLATKYANEGLNVLLFPTDQGTFEADEDRVVRIKFYQFYGFGQYPRDVVFDKVDIVGTSIHPFYRYLCRGLKNPNGIARITLNYEKFLLDKDGKVVRRYPRKLEAGDFEQDIEALVADKPLPLENKDYKLSWLKADQEAIKSEYAFKLGLNYYNNPPNMAR